MKVEITHEPKFKKLDNLFVLAAEGTDFDGIAADIADRARFTGRTDETITVLEDDPRKVTLVGLGKRDELTSRGLTKALNSVAKIAQKQRDKRIAVDVITAMPGMDARDATRLTASLLAQADYKYDEYLTQKKDEKRVLIEAVLVAPESLDGKWLREIEREAKALSDGIRTVRDLGNAPSNIVTPVRLAERAAEVAKQVGVKCTIYERKDIEKMKMGGLIAVNRGSDEEPRFVVMEYKTRRASRHVALVGKGITFDS
ncbi:MAG TPA: M17 family peptidase N-terminal domain-containing protein, partial [Thermoanaerobaculia bacterium]|nr:M17 family peptidase N-terminal domain-containing protein [Thermoanaerobaculia bacterium]